MNLRKLRNIIMIILLLLIMSFDSQFTLSYLFDKTSPIVSKFVPYEYETNDLIINKNIEHSLGSDYVIPNGIEFEFEVDLGIYYANQSIFTSVGELKTDEKGILNIKVIPNIDFIISNIDVGTKIKVIEIMNKPGFFTKDELVKEVIISMDECSKIKFVNVYIPKLVTGENINLIGQKVLEGREWQEEDKFSFKLEYFNENNEWEVIGEKDIIYEKDNIDFSKYDFNEIMNSFNFNIAGIYKFRLSEVAGNLENVLYDNTINNFEIIVGDALMDGHLEIQEIVGYQNIKVSKKDIKYIIDVVFNNVYNEIEVPGIDYVDDEGQSILNDDVILVKDVEYDIETIISRFTGLSDDFTYSVYDMDGNIYEGNLVRTGDYVIINDNNNEYRFDLVLSGDTSGDGLITPLDYIKIKNHIIGNTELTGELYMLAADISGDNKITPLDYIKIKNYIIKGGN